MPNLTHPLWPYPEEALHPRCDETIVLRLDWHNAPPRIPSPRRPEAGPRHRRGAPHRGPAARGSHRQRPRPAATRQRSASRRGRLRLLLAVVTASLVAGPGVLGVLISYPLLHGAAVRAVLPAALTVWWPLLVYGPWLLACLSVIRAALRHRPCPHAWLVLLLFTGIAATVCVAQAPTTLTGIAVAALPPVSALAVFHQAVRILTLPPPRHARSV